MWRDQRRKGFVKRTEKKNPCFTHKGQEEVLTSLESSREGLSTTEAKNRLEMYGRNELEEGKNVV